MAKGKTKKVLGRDAFLSNSANLKREAVELDDGIVYVRELSGKGLLEYREKIEALQKDNPEITPAASVEIATLLVSKTACDENGKLLFSEEDVEALADNSLTLLMRLASKALELSGISKSAIDEVNKQIKNAESSPTIE